MGSLVKNSRRCRNCNVLVRKDLRICPHCKKDPDRIVVVADAKVEQEASQNNLYLARSGK
jgi:RNA polymerase subunit RPABC4/transcription elongation factor Spt4